MLIASASTAVKFHELPSGTALHSYQPGAPDYGPVRSISWSKDGNWLALVPHSGPVEIVSVKEHLKLLHVLQGIEEPLCASFQNTTKKNVAVGTKSGQVLLYDIKARGVKKRYPRTTSAITIVEFTPKDHHLVVACENGEAYIYSNVTNNLAGSFKIPRSQSIGALRTNPIKRNYIVAGSNEGVVAVWDIHGNKAKFCNGSHKAPVTAVAFSPINSDLVVSTGLDRQFCFYDIGANKCIGSIFVENSIVSVDFSFDGKFLVMGSQNGKIHVYDSKNIQQPIYSFSGHDGGVEHLSFRKNEDYETSFNMSVPKELQQTVETLRNYESFTTYMSPENNVQVAVTSTEVFNADESDSFAVAMGLGQNYSVEASELDSAQRPAVPSKRFSTNKFTPASSKLLHEKVLCESKNKITSTPNLTGFEVPPFISPIVGDHPTETNFNVESMESLMKKIIKEELKVASQELKEDMKFYSIHNLSETRQIYLGMLMSMTKEFIKVENNLDNLRNHFMCDVDSLVEENMLLKEKVTLLEDELATLKTNIFNKNF